MSWNGRRSRRIVVVCAMILYLGGATADAWASGRGPGARPRGHVSRSGPASSGSIEHRRAERPPGERADGRGRQLPTRERRAVRRADAPHDASARAPREPYADRPPARTPERARRREIRESRRDYYDDRRDFARGVRFSASWWTHSCSRTTVIVEDDYGYTYYECDGVWFSRTYYGGEVVYTVTDPPAGY